MTNLNNSRFPQHTFPILGICGYSGAGKTTLIESIVRDQTAKGRRICVIKNDVHSFTVDVPGKDTYRCFEAGADVVIHNRTEGFFRTRATGDVPLETLFRRLSPYYDGFLLEGHKSATLPDKVWLLHPENDEVPDVPNGFIETLSREADRFDVVSRLFDTIIENTWQHGPVVAAVLIGGESRRFGMPKHLYVSDGKTWLERIVEILSRVVDDVVVVGRGELPATQNALPRLTDVPHAAGPVAGMLAAFRWYPTASFVFMPCDTPLVSEEAVRWLLSNRGVDRCAVLPKLREDAPCEPLFAYYDRRAAPMLETVQGPHQISSSPRVAQPVVPPHLAAAWTNVNEHGDLPAGG